MSNLTNNTAELRDILAAVNALPEAGGGGITPSGTIEITENGPHDVTDYATAEVDVQPKLTMLITKAPGRFYPSDGYDGFSSVSVDIDIPTIKPLTVTNNGVYMVSSGGYNPVTVDVKAVTEELSITENGEYTPGDGVDGFSKVTVNVPTGGNTDMEDNLIKGTAKSYSNHRVTSVGTYCFYSQSNLQSVDLPNVTSTGLYAFQKAGLLSVTLPSLQSVAASAFNQCTKLVSADFLVLTNIAILAFAYSSKFETLILRNTSRVCTLANANAFTSTLIASGTGYIYVPRTLDDGRDGPATYAAATNWSTYAAQVRAIEDYPEITGG